MNAPFIWIAVPFLAGLVILLLPKNYAPLGGGIVAAFLSLSALFIPIDTPLLIGSFSLKISTSVDFFGRTFELSALDGALLAVIYGLSAFWFFGVYAPNQENRFVSLGLMIISLFTASIAVEPFLYAALLLEVAAMLAIPLLLPLYQQSGRSVLRFLVYQTLAMPFILFAGWMLAGVEASPGELGATLQAGAMLGLGFAFLFGVFPLYNWIPMLMEEVSPYAAGFLLWALSTFTCIFALGFLDRYTWIRSSPYLSSAIIYAGIFMVASSGIFAAMQKHLGRIMGYAAILEMGLIVLAMGLQSSSIVTLIFLILIPRGLELVLWAFSLSILKRGAFSLRFGEIRGIARKYPIASAGLLIAHLSVAGFPLLAGFSSRFALWQELSRYSLVFSFWIFIGILGLLAAAIRALAVFVMADEHTPWQMKESWLHVVMILLGIFILFALGVFPQVLQPFIAGLPEIFPHLSR